MLLAEGQSALNVAATVLGWLYNLIWALSYYPQMIKNWQRKSVDGLSIDFILFNLFGYAMYTLFNLSLYFDTPLRLEYMKQFDAQQHPVFLNDLLLCIHNLVAISIELGQIFMYRESSRSASSACLIILTLWILIVIVLVMLKIFNVLTLLLLVALLGYFKMGASTIKYFPQAYMNYKQQAVTGLSMPFVFLDLTGGIFCVLNIVLLAALSNTFAEMIGNVPKLTVGVVSIIFPTVFILQRYLFYAKESTEASEIEKEERQSLKSLKSFEKLDVKVGRTSIQ